MYRRHVILSLMVSVLALGGCGKVPKDKPLPRPRLKVIIKAEYGNEKGDQEDVTCMRAYN